MYVHTHTQLRMSCLYQLCMYIHCVCSIARLSLCSLLLAVCMDGSFYRYLFTTDPGQTNNCVRDSFDIFLDIGNDGI